MSISSERPQNLEIVYSDPYLSRAKYIKEKMKDLENKILHYRKLKCRWSNVDSIFKGVGTGLTLVLSISSGITGVLIIPTLIPIIFSIITALNASVNSVLVIGLSSKKKAEYRSKVSELKRVLDKCYIFYLEAIEDKSISDDELTKFNKIYNECLTFRIDDQSNLIPQNSLSPHQINKIKCNAQKEAKNELKQEIQKKFKNEFLSNARVSV